ncbi:Serine/threonine protein kinase [Handroanthus impetiginosus]|uniref:non-specific serine/threonine protein kinase n=1 Tax=Handroanthus impetiginosus TaxID=429701 RepID=A0A2G9GAD4_9LAMI|nr:Serine/threonine protein kinase [Handroanthus impetiginosus]
MNTFRYTSGNAFKIAIFLVFLIPSSDSVNFRVSRFSPEVTVILLKGDAVNYVGELQFNMVNYVCRVGQIIYNGRVPLWGSKPGKLADFTTHFSFTIDTQNRTTYGNGIAFFLAPVGFQIPPNSVGGFLGLFNTSTTDSNRSQIVSVEFDSFANPEWDPPYEHVGINKNSIKSLATFPWNRTAYQKNVPTKPTSAYRIFYKRTYRVPVPVPRTKEYREFDINDGNGNTGKKIGLIVGLTLSGCVLIAAAGVAFVVLRKYRERTFNKNNPEAANLTSINDDLERGAGPRRFSYQDLALATNNFSDERKLGEGGFGGVYKGYLIDLDIPIAVKKISRGSKQGKKQYVTEVKIISMLRHRNLVQLIGWCHDQGEFLLVYEFMPNGSLDYHLFGRRNPLSWTVRFKIALGLASALLYLHEEWEQCVVHRDIKSSNVMLDSSFNVKLGDFGLARLMDHELGPQTTGLAGTLGYLAPEYVTTGRASKESDVYSFGVVALEIATGRKSADKRFEKGLVAWVWDFYGTLLWNKGFHSIFASSTPIDLIV